MKQVLSLAVPAFWFLSFFFSLPLVEPYEVSRWLALGFGVAALGVVLSDAQNRAAVMKVAPLSVLVLAFLVWCGVTFFWSLSPFVTVISWGTLCLLPLWFLIFALMPVSFLATLRVAVGAITLLAVWALVQYFMLPQFLDVNGSLRYPFADPNNYAGLLNMGLFAALGLFFSAGSGRGRMVLAGCCVVMVVAMVLMASRMGIVTAVMGVMAFTGLSWRTAGFNRKIVLGIMAAAVMALAVSAQFNDQRVTSVERAADMIGTEDKSVTTRFAIWESTREMIDQRIWLGSGLGTFFLLYPAVRDESEIYSSGLMAHNDPLQFWAETGVPGVVLLYAILIAVMVGFQKFVWQAKGSERLLATGLFCALLTLAMHMHVTFHLYVASLLTLSGLLLGVLARMMPGRVLVTCKIGTPGLTVLIVMLAFLVVFQSCLFSEMHARQAVVLMNRNDVEGFSDKINQAGREGFGLNPRPYVLAASIPLGILTTSTLPPAEKEALFKQTDGLLDQGLAVSPVNAGAYFSKALLYGAMGRGNEAVRFLEHTLAIDPSHKQARAMLGR